MHLTSLDENVLDYGYDITDGIYAICSTPMFAAQPARFYSYAEHSCHAFDYTKENFDEILTLFKPLKSKKFDGIVTNNSLTDLTKKEILLFILMNYIAYPFLFAKIETHTNFKKNNARVLSGFLKSIGYDYKIYGSHENNACFTKAENLISYVYSKVTEEVIDENYYNKDARYMYYEPSDIIQMFISRFNEVAPFKLCLLNKSEATELLKYHLQRIKMV